MRISAFTVESSSFQFGNDRSICWGCSSSPLHSLSLDNHFGNVKLFLRDSCVLCDDIKVYFSASLLTIVTISVERYMAFRLRLRYRAVVTFKRVVSILVSEWIIAFLWSGLRFWSETAGAISGAVSLISCGLIALACYFAIRRGIRGHVTQIRQQQNHGRTAIAASNFDLQHYRKTLRNMMWISGLLVACYMPFLLTLFATLIIGLKNSTRFAVGFSTIAVYLNSSLNPVLYCWRIKDLRDGVLENFNRVCNCLFHLIRSSTQNEITGNTTASIPRPFQRQGPGNEDI